MLDDIFGNRKIIATLDLPNQLEKVARWLPSSYDVESIAYRHTLFPLYGPFIPEERRRRCLQWMAGASQGRVHLAMGVAASVVKAPSVIRYCPGCVVDQKETFGEYFWRRDWQVSGVEFCERHGELIGTSYARPLIERHSYHAASPQACPSLPQDHRVCKQSLWVLNQVRQLLDQKAAPSPRFDQWSSYYHSIAQQLGYIRRRTQVDHEAIAEAVLARWPPWFLHRYGLLPTRDHGADTLWLKAIFRKHRKSFSYLQHIAVHEALLAESWSVTEIIDRVRHLPTSPISVSKKKNFENEDDLSRDQILWIRLISSSHPRAARANDPALYARLYRHHHEWLIHVNHHQKMGKATERRQRIDWQARDLCYQNKLIKILDLIGANTSGQRRSRSCLLSQLGKKSTLEKNLHRLPRTRQLLDKYSETVAQYQVRRLQNCYSELKMEHEYPPRWRVLRSARLSDVRLTDEACEYLNKLEVDFNGIQRDREK